MNRYVTDLQLAERYGVHRTTIWRWSNTGTIPPPIQLTTGCTRWSLDEIEQRDAERESARSAPPVTLSGREK